MPDLSIKASELQIGLPVYCLDNESAGKLRFTIASVNPPYEVEQLVVEKDSSIGNGSFAFPVSKIDYVDWNGIHTLLLKSEISEMEDFSPEPYLDYPERRERNDYRDRADRDYDKRNMRRQRTQFRSNNKRR